MSRIGKQPIPVPAGVKIKLDDRLITVTGGQGSLSRELPPRVRLEMDQRKSGWSPRTTAG
jgi:large subunit ribosomal protein L6